MFRVERMGVDDFSFAVQLANTMDWNMAFEDFGFMAKLEPKGCFVLFHGPERVGIATSVSFGKVGWFGNLIVKEDCRRRGAGAFLVKHAVDYLKSTGTETIGLYAYPHLIEFYENFGFKPDVDFLVLQGKAISSATEGTLQLREAKKQDVSALMEFDCQCFGAHRKKLLKPILLNTGNLCYISADNHEITGYCAAKVYEEMAEIGPLMCRQNRVDAAVTLLKTVLGKLRNLDVFTCVPAEETALLGTLFKAGFRENFRVTRMFLGPAVAKNCTYIAESLERG
ncbi:MAG TPA: GNAT family N-acetyltransferase [Candidatus Bathyarchaeia archaeon]|nr:GNAT family N-acetyltransferase [Candidatus Bathyarchaeia archaeon]